ADHGEVRLKVEDRAQPLPHDCVVVHHQDPDLRSLLGVAHDPVPCIPAPGIPAPAVSAGTRTLIRRPPPRLRRSVTSPPSSAARSAMFRTPCPPGRGTPVLEVPAPDVLVPAPALR